MLTGREREILALLMGTHLIAIRLYPYSESAFDAVELISRELGSFALVAGEIESSDFDTYSLEVRSIGLDRLIPSRNDDVLLEMDLTVDSIDLIERDEWCVVLDENVETIGVNPIGTTSGDGGVAPIGSIFITVNSGLLFSDSVSRNQLLVYVNDFPAMISYTSDALSIRNYFATYRKSSLAG